ncbi:unnamed protein product [Coregonus sp. 'balchen']|nr:unnamed protein product [Coregonus sp. 'balchen']
MHKLNEEIGAMEKEHSDLQLRICRTGGVRTWGTGGPSSPGGAEENGEQMPCYFINDMHKLNEEIGAMEKEHSDLQLRICRTGGVRTWGTGGPSSPGGAEENGEQMPCYFINGRSLSTEACSRGFGKHSLERAQQKLLNNIPDALQNRVGQHNGRYGSIKVFNTLQETSANKHLLYILLERFLKELCPELNVEMVQI